MDKLKEELKAEITEAVLNELKAEVTEAVLNECKGSILTDVIDTVIRHHEHMVRALMYDDAPAQNQSTADTLVCREMKADLVERSKPSTSNMPVYYPPGHAMSPFDGNTHTAGAQILKTQDKATEGGEMDDPTTKDVTKAKASEASSKTELSLQDRVIATAKGSLGGVDDPGHAYAQNLRKRFRMEEE